MKILIFITYINLIEGTENLNEVIVYLILIFQNILKNIYEV